MAILHGVKQPDLRAADMEIPIAKRRPFAHPARQIEVI
jgi:hypothetical protein